MGGIKRISQVAKVSTVNVRLQPWAQQLVETSRPPASPRTRTDSWSTRSSDTAPSPKQTVSKVPNKTHQEGNKALLRQNPQPKAPSSRATKSSKAAKVSSREPTEQEVLTAVESLYDDELKPYGRILRKRFIEHLEEAGGKAEEVDLGHIRVICESSTRLSMESEPGGEWSAVLCDRQPAFVDVYSEEDPYPEAVWSEAAAHFAQLTGEESLLPGGRYACAQALVQRGVAFIRGRSLGQVCHLVQLALGHRKILGYINGAIAPYGHSRACLKDSAAAQQSSCALAPSTHGAPELQIASWGIARDCLRKILDGAAASGRDYVPLSNIKRLFRSRFSLELSETAFGHARLSDLLQAAAFSDICTVQLLDRGYAVFAAPASSKEIIEAHVNEHEHETMERLEEQRSLPKTPHSWKPTFESRMCALSPSTLAKDGSIGCMVHNTFIHAAGPPPTPIGSSCRSSSLPKNTGSARNAWEASCHALSFRSRVPSPDVKAEEEVDDVPFLLLSPTLTASPSTSPAPYNAQALGRHGAATFPCSNGYGMQDQDASAFSDLSACLMGQILDFPWTSCENDGALAGNPCLEMGAPMVQESHARVKFCPNEPLCFEEEQEQTFEAAKPSNPCTGFAQKRVTLTPSTLRKSGFAVHNTFISSVSIPSTPILAAMRRSSSMPCIEHMLDEGEAEVSEATAQCFSFPGEPWLFEGASDANNAISPTLTASPAWTPQPRRGQLDPCRPLTLRISDLLSPIV